MDLRQSQRRRFAQILNYAREQRQLSLTELAHLLKRPKSTVSMWALARRLPPKDDLPLLCARLNINYEAIFMHNSVADACFEDQVLGFDALQARYLDLRLEDEYKALHLSLLAGAIMHGKLMDCGFIGSTNLAHDLKCVIDLAQPPAYISIDCMGQHGIGFTVYKRSREVIYAWHLLVKTNLDLLVQFLHSLES